MTTLGAAARAWFAALERPTRRDHRACVALARTLGAIPVADVTPADVARVANSANERGLRWTIVTCAEAIGVAGVRPPQKPPKPSAPPEDGARLAPEGLTLAEVADRLGLSRERVRQLEERALRKLRAALEADGLEVADVLAEPAGPRGPGGALLDLFRSG